MKVRCIDTINIGGNRTDYLTIGKEYSVINTASSNRAWIKDDDGDTIFIYTDGTIKHGEFEIVQEVKEMTKNDLVPGKHVVELRNGRYYLCIANGFTKDSDWITDDQYLSDLSDANKNESSGWDIVAVYELKYVHRFDRLLYEGNLEEIWRRESAEYTELMDKIKAHEESLAELKAQAEKLKGV